MSQEYQDITKEPHPEWSASSEIMKQNTSGKWQD